jgi:hypothetical protein
VRKQETGGSLADVAEIVEQQERVEIAGVAEPEGAVKSPRRLPWWAWT